MSELLRERAADDWSEVTGLRNVVIALLLRGLMVLPVWAGVVWLIQPVIEMFPFSWRAMGGVAVLFAVPGIAIGHAMSRKINEIAGFQSILLTIMALAVITAVVSCGVWIAGAFGHALPNWGGFVTMAVAAFAGVWTVRNVHFSD